MVAVARTLGLVGLVCAASACVVSAGEPATVIPAQQTEGSQTKIAPRKVVYKTTPQRDLSLHIFEPDRLRFPDVRPAALIIHGGGWVGGDPKRFYDQARHLADAGMVAIAAEYRLKSVDGTGPDKALEDAKSAIRFLRANAREFGFDPDRLVVVGGSAGGQLAAALGTAEGFDDPRDDVSISTRPAALVLYNPVIDNGPDGYGHEMVRDYWQRFSPLHNISSGHPPTLFMLGTRDELVPVQTGQSYCDKVAAVGSDCQLRLYEGQPHAFYNRKRSERYYRETTEAMDAFLASLGYIEPAAAD